MKGKGNKKRKISLPFVITILLPLLLFIPKVFADEDELVFYFDPIGNRSPVIYDLENPENGSIDVGIRPSCSIQIGDPDDQAMDIYWYENSTGSWILRHTTSSVYNGTYSWTFSQAYNYTTTYYWRVVVSDGQANASEIYHFTTGEAPPPPPPPPPPQGNLPPIANITGPLFGYVNETIIFYGNESFDYDGNITGYRWDFNNDGLFDTDWDNFSFESHIFNISGNYTVKLQVRDDGLATDTDTLNITIIPLEKPLELPIVRTNGPYTGYSNKTTFVNSTGTYDIYGNLIIGYTNETIFFNSSGTYDPDGKIVNYTWDFGDNNISYLPNTTHIYREAGTYIVTLTVRDNDNLTNSSVTTAIIKDRVDEIEAEEEEEDEIEQPLLLPVSLLISGIAVALILIKSRLIIVSFLSTQRSLMLKKKINKIKMKNVKTKTSATKSKSKTKK